MARRSSADVGFLLLGGYDILGDSTSLSIDLEAPTEETTALGDADQQFAPIGLTRATLSQEGFFNDAQNASHDALSRLTQDVLCVGLQGNSLGRKFVGLEGAIVSTYRRVLSRSGLHKASADYTVTGVVEDGVVHAVHAVRTAATFVGTAQDNTTSSSAGGAGYLQVSALTLGGYTSVTVKIRHSADNVTYADLVTFTAVTSAPRAERVAVTGTVNRYTRAEHTFNGTGTGQSIKYMVGFKRG